MLIQKCKHITHLFLFVLLIFFIYSCRPDELPVEPKLDRRGELVSSNKIGTYSLEFIRALVNSIAGVFGSNISLKYEVDVYSLVYKTRDPKGNLVDASGALYIPKGKNFLPIISIHHGTQTKRTSVASKNPLNSSEGLIAASLGYYTLIPDYLGLGESTIIHPYHHQRASAETVIDFIRAGREYAQLTNLLLNGQIFLAGYSEGGYVTLAAHKEIELNYRSEISVTASSPMAGAFDLILTARSIIKKTNYNQPLYLAFFFAAYNDIYNWNKLGDIFNLPYAERIPSLFDGTKSAGEINSQLTTSLNRLFKQSFIDGFLDGTETQVISAFQENSLLNWIPTAPIRFYHGDADEYVPYENSVNAKNYFRSVGADASLVTINGGTHASSVLPSIIGAMEWFESIRLKKLSPPHLAKNNNSTENNIKKISRRERKG